MKGFQPDEILPTDLVTVVIDIPLKYLPKGYIDLLRSVIPRVICDYGERLGSPHQLQYGADLRKCEMAHRVFVTKVESTTTSFTQLRKKRRAYRDVTAVTFYVLEEASPSAPEKELLVVRSRVLLAAIEKAPVKYLDETFGYELLSAEAGKAPTTPAPPPPPASVDPLSTGTQAGIAVAATLTLFIMIAAVIQYRVVSRQRKLAGIPGGVPAPEAGLCDRCNTCCYGCMNGPNPNAATDSALASSDMEGGWTSVSALPSNSVPLPSVGTSSSPLATPHHKPTLSPKTAMLGQQVYTSPHGPPPGLTQEAIRALQGIVLSWDTPSASLPHPGRTPWNQSQGLPRMASYGRGSGESYVDWRSIAGQDHAVATEKNRWDSPVRQPNAADIDYIDLTSHNPPPQTPVPGGGSGYLDPTDYTGQGLGWLKPQTGRAPVGPHAGGDYVRFW